MPKAGNAGAAHGTLFPFVPERNGAFVADTLVPAWEYCSIRGFVHAYKAVFAGENLTSFHDLACAFWTHGTLAGIECFVSTLFAPDVVPTGAADCVRLLVAAMAFNYAAGRKGLCVKFS